MSDSLQGRKLMHPSNLLIQFTKFVQIRSNHWEATIIALDYNVRNISVISVKHTGCFCTLLTFYIEFTGSIVTLTEVKEGVFKMASSTHTQHHSKVGSVRGCLPKIRSKLFVFKVGLLLKFKLFLQTQTFKQASQMLFFFFCTEIQSLIFVCASFVNKQFSLAATASTCHSHRDSLWYYGHFFTTFTIKVGW